MVVSVTLQTITTWLISRGSFNTLAYADNVVAYFNNGFMVGSSVVFVMMLVGYFVLLFMSALPRGRL